MSVKTFRALIPSIFEQKEVEARSRDFYSSVMDKPYCQGERVPGGTLSYLKKNVFSILFLALYSAIGLPRQRRLLYGAINQAIRGLVTSADNLLDDEYKEMLPLGFPKNAVRFKSIVQLLVFERYLMETLDGAVIDGLMSSEKKKEVLDALYRALAPIGAKEAVEEGGVREIIAPGRVLREFHTQRGGGLFALVFITPLIIETSHTGKLKLASDGVFRVGMALQAIDDLADFSEDWQRMGHNYLVSHIAHQGPGEEKALLMSLTRGSAPGIKVHESFPVSSKDVMERAIGEALQGMELMSLAGLDIGRKTGYELIRYLFKIRNAAMLGSLIPPLGDIQSNLEELYAVSD